MPIFIILSDIEESTIIWDTFSSVFEALSLTNSGKAFGIFPREVPLVIRLSQGAQLLGTSLGQIFPDNSWGFSTVCPTVGRLFTLVDCFPTRTPVVIGDQHKPERIVSGVV